MDQKKAIKILAKEKAYEERLVDDIVNYYLYSLYSVEDIDAKSKELIRKSLQIITHESIKHRYMFARLMDMVLKDGKAKY